MSFNEIKTETLESKESPEALIADFEREIEVLERDLEKEVEKKVPDRQRVTDTINYVNKWLYDLWQMPDEVRGDFERGQYQNVWIEEKKWGKKGLSGDWLGPIGENRIVWVTNKQYHKGWDSYEEFLAQVEVLKNRDSAILWSGGRKTMIDIAKGIVRLPTIPFSERTAEKMRELFKKDLGDRFFLYIVSSLSSVKKRYLELGFFQDDQIRLETIDQKTEQLRQAILTKVKEKFGIEVFEPSVGQNLKRVGDEQRQLWLKWCFIPPTEKPEYTTDPTQVGKIAMVLERGIMCQTSEGGYLPLKNAEVVLYEHRQEQ